MDEADLKLPFQGSPQLLAVKFPGLALSKCGLPHMLYFLNFLDLNTDSGKGRVSPLAILATLCKPQAPAELQL